MKPTYKLFGAYWDGMKAVRLDVLPKDSSPKQAPELISFRKLLSVQDEADLSRIIAPCDAHKGITIRIDYWTESGNPVLQLFLEKRLGQMVAHLSEKYPAVRCVKV
ncbi:MAG: hypothetical protein IJ706_07855 [Clostridia bacterium]|nr:hypothetical protein [Clostridia bacterium]